MRTYIWGMDSELCRNVIARLDEEGVIDVQTWTIDGRFSNDEFFAMRKNVAVVEPPLGDMLCARGGQNALPDGCDQPGT